MGNFTLERKPILSDVKGIPFSRGVQLEDGSYFFHVVGGEFGHYSAEGKLIRAFALPDSLLAPTFPNELDLAEYAADMEHFRGAPLDESQLRKRQQTPQRLVVPGTRPRLGAGGAVWVASNRDRQENSTLFVLTPQGYSQSLSVRDRLLAFDIIGDSLIVLVERPREPHEVGTRGIDIYRIVEVRPPA